MTATKTRAKRQAEPAAIEAPKPQGVVCPWCKTEGQSRVTKTYKSTALIRRRRLCAACNRGFYTDEKIVE